MGQKPIEAGPYIVCIMDLLGQGTKLNAWSMSAGTTDQDGVQAAFHETIDAIVKIRNSARDVFERLASIPLPEDIDKALTPEDRESFWLRKKHRVGVQQFSDTLVFYAKTVDDKRRVSVVPVRKMLLVITVAIREMWVKRVALRGSICVDRGAELENGSFYGPAIAKAHEIELKIAKYPRFVVADDVAAFLRTMMASKDKIERDLASQCAETICVDDDGCWIVDWLGKGSWLPSESFEVDPVVEHAYRFVRDEHGRFCEKGDTKLAGRYARLLSYMEPRLHHWGVAPRGAGLPSVGMTLLEHFQGLDPT